MVQDRAGGGAGGPRRPNGRQAREARAAKDSHNDLFAQKELSDAEKRWNAAWRNKDRSFLKAGHKLD